MFCYECLQICPKRTFALDAVDGKITTACLADLIQSLRATVQDLHIQLIDFPEFSIEI